MELHIAICDDDRGFASKLEDTLIKLASKMEDIHFHIDIYESGEALLRAMKQKAYHLLYLDMEMSGEDGVAVAKQLREMKLSMLIIFVTSHSSYMYRSFQVQPFWFLLKPIEEKELHIATVKAIELSKQQNDVFSFTMNQQIYHLRISEMMYITVEQGKKLVIATANESYTYYGKLGELALQLESYHFCRIHSGYVVNWEFVRSLGKNQVMLISGTRLPVSRTKSNDVLKSYHYFIEKRMLK
jgi:DNA-binding LytR/AlgR family response regulator